MRIILICEASAMKNGRQSLHPGDRTCLPIFL
jgi:hypothetical protein